MRRKSKIFIILIFLLMFIPVVFCDTNSDLASRVIVDMRFDNSTITSDYGTQNIQGILSGTGIIWNTSNKKLGAGSINLANLDPSSNELKMGLSDTGLHAYGVTKDITYCYWIYFVSGSANNHYFFEIDKTSGGNGHLREGSGTALKLQWTAMAINNYNVQANGNWALHCFGYNASLGWVTINSSTRITSATVPAGQNRDVGFCVYNDGASDCRAGNFNVDNLLIFNKTLSDAEINYLWNNSAGTTLYYVSPAPPKIIINNGSILHVAKLTENGTFLFNEQNAFYIEANITHDTNVYDGSSNCSVYATNFTDEWNNNKTNIGNITLDSSNSFEFTFTDQTTNVNEQRITFGVCNQIGNTNINLYISGNGNTNWNTTPYKIINASIIPNCPLYHTENDVLPTNMVDNIQNISIRCPNCIGTNTNKLIRLTQGGNYDITLNIDFDRKFSSQKETLVYNNTRNKYVFFSHMYGFDDNGQKILQFACNETTTNEVYFNRTYNINLVKPTASIISFNENDFINKSNIESGDITIACEISGTTLLVQNISVYYINGTFIKGNASGEYLEVDSELLNIDGNYSILCTGVNTNGTTTTMGQFQILDTSLPIIYDFDPMEYEQIIILNNESTKTITISLIGQDLNLYSVAVNISYVANNSPFYYEKVVPINTTSYGILRNLVFSNISANFSFYKRVSDAHTVKEIPIYETQKDLLGKEVSFTDYNSDLNVEVKLVSEQTPTNVITQKLRDRYTFTYLFNELKTDSIHSYRFHAGSTDILKVVPYSKIGCHFVIGDPETHYLDFDLPNCKDAKYNIEKTTGEYYCNIETSCNNLNFNSFGELNIIESTTYFHTLVVQTGIYRSGNISINCNFNPTPVITLGSDNKIEWGCDLIKRNMSEKVSCITKLYDAVNNSYLIQVNPSYDDYRSKTTLVGGGSENTKVNNAFEENNGIVIVYYDGSVFDDVKNRILVTGEVSCSSNYGDKGTFMGNFTPRFANYETNAIYKFDLGIQNAPMIVAIILGIMILGAVLSIILITWRRGVLQ